MNNFKLASNFFLQMQEGVRAGHFSVNKGRQMRENFKKALTENTNESLLIVEFSTFLFIAALHLPKSRKRFRKLLNSTVAPIISALGSNLRVRWYPNKVAEDQWDLLKLLLINDQRNLQKFKAHGGIPLVHMYKKYVKNKSGNMYQHILEISKILRKKKKIKEKNAETVPISQTDNEVLQNHSEILHESQNDNEVRQNHSEILHESQNDNEVRQNHSEIFHESQNDNEVRQNHSEILHESQNDNEVRQNHSEIFHESQNDNEVRQNHAEILHEDPIDSSAEKRDEDAYNVETDVEDISDDIILVQERGILKSQQLKEKKTKLTKNHEDDLFKGDEEVRYGDEFMKDIENLIDSHIISKLNCLSPKSRPKKIENNKVTRTRKKNKPSSSQNLVPTHESNVQDVGCSEHDSIWMTASSTSLGGEHQPEKKNRRSKNRSQNQKASCPSTSALQEPESQNCDEVDMSESDGNYLTAEQNTPKDTVKINSRQTPTKKSPEKNQIWKDSLLDPEKRRQSLELINSLVAQRKKNIINSPGSQKIGIKNASINERPSENSPKKIELNKTSRARKMLRKEGKNLSIDMEEFYFKRKKRK